MKWTLIIIVLIAKAASSQEPVLMLPIGHTDHINTIEYSPVWKSILTASNDNTARLWNRSGKLLAKYTHGAAVNTAHYNRDGTRFVTASDDGTAKICDAFNGKLISTIKLTGEQVGINNAIFSPDGGKILTVSSDGSANIWLTDSTTFTYSIGEHPFREGLFSPNGTLIALSSGNDVFIYDELTTFLVTKLSGHNKEVIKIMFSYQSNLLYTLSKDSTVKIWDSHNGRLWQTISVKERQITDFDNSPNGRLMLVAAEDSLVIYDIENEKIVKEIEDPFMRIQKARFSRTGKIVSLSTENDIKIWDVETGQLERKLDNNNRLFDMVLNPDRTKILASTDKEVKAWDVETGELEADLAGLVTTSANSMLDEWKASTLFPITTIKEKMDHAQQEIFIHDNMVEVREKKTGKVLNNSFIIDSSDYMVLLPGGFYMSTKKASSLLHYVTPRLEVIDFEQLDVIYNRPDKVLAAIGSRDTGLIKSYRRAWEKRIKKLGIDTMGFRKGISVPAFEIQNDGMLMSVQPSDRVGIHLIGKDENYVLDHYNVWVNGTPVYGQKGISIRFRKQKTSDDFAYIPLSKGVNKIEAAVFNINGISSNRIQLNLTYHGNDREEIYFLGIGADHFADTSYNLRYSRKDIRDLALVLKSRYPNIIIDTLFNEQVTIKNVRKMKEKLLNMATEDDKVVLAYSGHGLLNKNFDYYLSTYQVNFEKPEEKGLPYEELETLLDSIPPRKKLLLIDACHSGEVDKEELLALNNIPDSLQLKKGLKPVGYKKDSHVGLQNSFELMQNLFLNVGKSTGAVIISAAAGNQFALERDDLANGVFTYSILEALKENASISVNQLKRIASKKVQQLTNGLQQPTSRNETLYDWKLW